jgi:RimJ/RimL family protein N-acetyltransferase
VNGPLATVTTDRLYQRPWRPEDADAVAAMYAKPQVMTWIPGGAWDCSQTQRFITRMIDLRERQDLCIYPVLLKESDRIIGHCGLNRLEGGPEIEIAYLFDEPYWGQGLATEIARACVSDHRHLAHRGGRISEKRSLDRRDGANRHAADGCCPSF